MDGLVRRQDSGRATRLVPIHPLAPTQILGPGGPFRLPKMGPVDLTPWAPSSFLPILLSVPFAFCHLFLTDKMATPTGAFQPFEFHVKCCRCQKSQILWWINLKQTKNWKCFFSKSTRYASELTRSCQGQTSQLNEMKQFNQPKKQCFFFYVWRAAATRKMMEKKNLKWNQRFNPGGDRHSGMFRSWRKCSVWWKCKF